MALVLAPLSPVSPSDDVTRAFEALRETGAVQRGPWAVKAWLSLHDVGRWRVQVEHREPEHGGWVRYQLGTPATGPTDYPSLAVAHQAAVAFLLHPSLTRCIRNL